MDNSETKKTIIYFVVIYGETEKTILTTKTCYSLREAQEFYGIDAKRKIKKIYV